MKLIDAIKNNDVDNVKVLLGSEDVFDPNILNPNDFKEAFVNACQNGNLEMVELLFADNRLTDKRFKIIQMIFPIMGRAYKNGYAQIVKLLFERYKDMKSAGFLGFPLSHYIDPNSPDIYQAILDFRKNPFSCIEKKGNLGEKSLTDAVKQLLDSAGANPAENDNNALFCAAKDGYFEVVKQLWKDKGVRLSLKDNMLEIIINEATSNGHEDIVRFFEACKEQRKLLKQNPVKLIDAIKNNDIDNVKIRLENEDISDPDVLNPEDMNEIFFEICKNGDLEMLALLLADDRFFENKLNIIPAIYSLMLSANKKGHTQIVKLLFERIKDEKFYAFLGFPLSRYIDPNSPNIFQEIFAFQRDPFSYIKEKSNLGEKSLTEFVRMLLDTAGADPAAGNYNAFYNAAKCGHLGVVKLLWEDKRIRHTIEDSLFERAINGAAASGHLEVVEFLKTYDHEFEDKLPPQARLERQLRALKKTSDPRAFKEKLMRVLPSLYENSHQDFDRWIITDLAGATKENPDVDMTAFLPSETFYNLDRYDNEGLYAQNLNTTKGLPLTTEEGIPIGYVIQLPQGEVKSVLVQVYGGGNAENKLGLWAPTTTDTKIDAKLKQEGVAIIHLNLVDLLTSTNAIQSEMDQALHEKLHKSIDTFYLMIKNHPEKLHASLVMLKNKPLTLAGVSFGGRTAVKHAELYPQTFDYYISIDGALSPEMLRKSDINLGNIRYKTDKARNSEAWSSPTNGIENIKDPILFVHNVDDNNVNLKVTMDWYKKADAAGKSPLMRMLIMDKGSAFPTKESDVKPYNAGHFLATDQKSVERLSHLITQFTCEGPSNLPEYTNWVGYKYEMVANQNYISASVEESFIAQAHRLYRKAKSVMPTDETLSDIYYTFHYLHNIDSKTLVNDLFTINDAGLLTDEVLSRGLQAHLKTYLNYLKETEGLTDVMPSDLNMDELITKPLLEKYKAALLEEPSGEHLKRSPLLTSLFLANPSLIQQVSNYQSDPVVQHNMEQARDNFKAVIKEEKRLIRSLWRAAARETLQLEKGRKTLRLGQVPPSKRKQDVSPSPAQEERVDRPGKKPG